MSDRRNPRDTETELASSSARTNPAGPSGECDRSRFEERALRIGPGDFRPNRMPTSECDLVATQIGSVRCTSEYEWHASPIWRSRFPHSRLRALSRAVCTAGKRREAKTVIEERTTKSSKIVTAGCCCKNPKLRLSFVRELCRFISISAAIERTQNVPTVDWILTHGSDRGSASMEMSPVTRDRPHRPRPQVTIAAPAVRNTQGVCSFRPPRPSPTPQNSRAIVDHKKPIPYHSPPAVVGISAPCACP